MGRTKRDEGMARDAEPEVQTQRLGLPCVGWAGKKGQRRQGCGGAGRVHSASPMMREIETSRCGTNVDILVEECGRARRFFTFVLVQ